MSLLALAICTAAMGGVVTYEADTFPQEGLWERTVFCTPDRWLLDGWLFQHVDAPGECGPPPNGDLDRYLAPLDPFVNEPEFFIEWRMQTDGDSEEILGTAPSSLAAGGSFGVTYHFTIANDQVRFIQDNFLPIVWADIDPDTPHTYRLEHYTDELFVWYIDGEVVASGAPEGAFPLIGSVLSWRAKSWYLESTTRWDYIRYGAIPEDASGDFDSDGDVDADDAYFFIDCLLGPGSSWPGCSWADMNADGVTDGDDVQAFVDAMLGQ